MTLTKPYRRAFSVLVAVGMVLVGVAQEDATGRWQLVVVAVVMACASLVTAMFQPVERMNSRSTKRWLGLLAIVGILSALDLLRRSLGTVVVVAIIGGVLIGSAWREPSTAVEKR